MKNGFTIRTVWIDDNIQPKNLIIVVSNYHSDNEIRNYHYDKLEENKEDILSKMKSDIGMWKMKGSKFN